LLEIQVNWGFVCQDELGPHIIHGVEVWPLAVVEVHGNVEAIRIEKLYGIKY